MPFILLSTAAGGLGVSGAIRISGSDPLWLLGQIISAGLPVRSWQPPALHHCSQGSATAIGNYRTSYWILTNAMLFFEVVETQKT